MFVPSIRGAAQRALASILACVLLAAACGSSGASEERPVVVEGARLRVLQSRGDVVSLGVEGGRPVLIVRRERGIGGATLEADGGAWPGEIVVALEGFRNLESLAACSGGRCLETDLRSAPQARLREGRDERWAVGVEVTIEVRAGSIRAAVPAAAAAGGSALLELRWVDEYRD